MNRFGFRRLQPPGAALVSTTDSLVAVLRRRISRHEPRRDESSNDSHYPVVEAAADNASLVVALVWGSAGDGTHDERLTVGEQETTDLRAVIREWRFVDPIERRDGDAATRDVASNLGFERFINGIYYHLHAAVVC